MADAGTTTPLDDVCARAVVAGRALDAMGRHGRARVLVAMADALEARRPELVRVADEETRLGVTRLGGELSRTAFQLRFLAGVVTDGAHLGATIDPAGPTPAGPRPDLRRIMRPRGVVAVFGASNFPFAFSVPGGDTASALAAGCAVVAKVHEGHPVTSELSGTALAAGAAAAGAPADCVQLVSGQQTGLDLVRHPAVAAVAFTGSLRVGRLLFDAAAARPVPVPFFGEMGALNVVVVAPGAARSRGPAIGDGLAASALLGTGQFCSQPGLVLLPAGPDGDALVSTLTARFREAPAGTVLTERTRHQFRTVSAELVGAPGVTVMATGEDADPDSLRQSALLLAADPGALTGPLLQECFGPVLLVSRYRDQDELDAVTARLSGALTATVHADPSDGAVSRALLDRFADTVGRVVWNGYPTGVAVAWAMQHGGPWPAATDAGTTSVGAGSIGRWLRPVAYQDVPADLLPVELRDGDVDLPRRVDGQVVPAATVPPAPASPAPG